MFREQAVSVGTAKAILDAFNAHDLDAIMEFFADDCTLDMPRGPDPWGQRYAGKAAVREGLATRFRTFQTSTTAMTAIGLAETWSFRNGC